MSYRTFKKIARYLGSERTKIAAIKELGDAGENISIVVESSPTKWQAYSLAGGSKDVEMMDTYNARDDNDNNDNENTNEETVYAGLASSKPKRDTAIEGNNNTLKKSHATRLKKHEPITKLDQIGLTRTKKLEYAVLSSSAKFCDAIPYLDEITATNPNTPYHHLMTVSLTNVDFRNRSGGAPKQLSLYKKPKLTVVSTCKAAREVIFDALHGNVELDDLKLISSENENDASLADQVESLYTSQQLSLDTTPVAEEAEMSKEMGIRYDALFEALFTMRDELAEQRSKRDGKSVRNYMVCSETCLQALARAAAGGGCATLEEVKKLTTFTDAAWNVFIRQHHQKIWATMVKTRRVLDNPELMADIGAASANFEAFEYVAPQQPDGPGAGVKRSQSDLDPSPTRQKAKR